MFIMRIFIASLLFIILGGCAVQEQHIQQHANLWKDAHFAPLEIRPLTTAEIFNIGPALESQIRSANLQQASIQERADFLLNLIYTSSNRPFLYEGYHTTAAKETWERNHGDCLSLSILAYAIGKRLQLPISIQEIPLPVQFDRRGKTEYLNAHVNTIILNPQLAIANDAAKNDRGYMLIDFDPGQFTQKRGTLLSEQEVVARFYSNLGAEAMFKNKPSLAYHYFKAALTMSPTHTPSHLNLASLYQSQGLNSEAIVALKRGLQIKAHDAVMLRELQRAYLNAGMHAEAHGLDQAIQLAQDSDPYFWIGRGLQSLQARQYAAAIQALEKAQKLSTGFEEVHQYLAEAYWRVGNIESAKQQMKILSGINSTNPKLRFLRATIAAN